jgi:hypothetical protein
MSVARELERLGFFRHVKRSDVPRVRALLEERGFMALDENDASHKGDSTHRF